MLRAILAIVMVTLLFGACGGVSSPGGASDSMTIVMIDMRFNPNRIDMKVGRPMVVRLINQGSQRHDLAFPALHMPGLEAIETALEPGQSTTITLRFDEPGTHTFICTIPGHFAAGMSGAAFVSD